MYPTHQPSTRFQRRNRLRATALALSALVLAGCSGGAPEAHAPPAGGGARDTSFALPLDVVLADAGTLAGSAGTAAPPAPVAHIIRVRPAAPDRLEPPLPEADIEAPSGSDQAPSAIAAPGLKPPIPRGTATYLLTADRSPDPPFVELEVLVGAGGNVLDVVWSDGARDSLHVAEARACALGMQFYPALLDGEPVPVWCRQRFEYSQP